MLSQSSIRALGDQEGRENGRYGGQQHFNQLENRRE